MGIDSINSGLDRNNSSLKVMFFAFALSIAGVLKLGAQVIDGVKLNLGNETKEVGSGVGSLKGQGLSRYLSHLAVDKSSLKGMKKTSNKLEKSDIEIYKSFFEWLANKYGMDVNELFQGGIKSEFYDFLFSRIPESNDLHLFSQNELLAEGLKLSANEGNFMTEEQASLVSSLLPFFDDKGNLVLGDREELYSSKLNDIFPGYEIDLKKVHLLSDGTICFSLKDGTLCVDKFGKWFVFSPREAVYNGLFVPLYESFDKFLAELSEMSALDFLGNCNVIKSVFGNNMGRDDREDLVRLFGGNYDRSRLLRLLLNGEIKVIMLDHVCVGIGSACYFYDKPTKSDISGAFDLGYNDVYSKGEHWTNRDGVMSKVLDGPSDYMKNGLEGGVIGVNPNDPVYNFESGVTKSGVPVFAPVSK